MIRIVISSSSLLCLQHHPNPTPPTPDSSSPIGGEEDRTCNVNYALIKDGSPDLPSVLVSNIDHNLAHNTNIKDALETLLSVVSPNDDSLSEEEFILGNEKKLQRVVKEVGRIVLKYHPDLQDKDETKDEVHDNRPKKRVAVDIWAVRASASISTNQSDKDPAFVSPH